jgi:thiamine biosynthesis protein ThiS
MSWSSHLLSRVIDKLGNSYLGRPTPQSMVVSPPMSERIAVVINGQTRTVVQGTTVAALIVELGLADRRVAVERNLEVVPRAQHASTLLAAGDRLELVTFVGGG